MLNIIIPMGGKGQRFKNAGYTMTKPLIDVNGMPMIQRVINNLNLKGRFIFLISKDDNKEYGLTELLKKFCGDNECITILEDPNKRQGAAAACLLAEKYINNSEPLFIANSDQLIEWNSSDFLKEMHKENADGGILTFTAYEDKWSFAKTIPGTNIVDEVAEKNPISSHATVGVYYYKRGSDFVNGAKQMIKKEIKTREEYYVCPVYNEIIEQGKLIINYPIAKMQGIGTPEDLLLYLNNNK